MMRTENEPELTSVNDITPLPQIHNRQSEHVVRTRDSPRIGEYPVCLVLHIYLSVLNVIIICRRRSVSRVARCLVRLGCFVLYGMATGYVSDWYLPWHGTKYRVLRQLWWYVVPGYGVYLVSAVLDEWRGWKDWRRRKRGRDSLI